MSQEGRKKLTSGAEARTHFQRAPLAASFALSTVMTTKVFISQRPGGVARAPSPAHPPAGGFALSTVMTAKVFISQRPGGVARTLLSAQTSPVRLLFNRKLGTTSSI